MDDLCLYLNIFVHWRRRSKNERTSQASRNPNIRYRLFIALRATNVRNACLPAAKVGHIRDGRCAGDKERKRRTNI